MRLSSGRPAPDEAAQKEKIAQAQAAKERRGQTQAAAASKKATRRLKKDAAPVARERRGEGEDLATYVTTVLSKTKTGLKLVDIVKQVLDMGYKTQSNNLSQAVYNVLSMLRKENKVEKDAESKKYSLVGTTNDPEGHGRE